MARVTLVVNSVDEGSETFLHSLARQLATIGHRVTVHALLRGRTTMPTGAQFGADRAINSSDALPAVRSPLVLPAAARLAVSHRSAVTSSARRAVTRFGRGRRAARAVALAAPILATRPDVVHVAFSGIGVALVDAIELLEPETRLVVSCRGTGELVTPMIDESVRPGLRRVLERADAVHAVADTVGRAAVRWGADPAKVRVIRPGVDVMSFRPVGPNQRTGERLRVVTVARLHWIKAIDVQLTALAELRRRGHDVAWEIIGDGPERSALEFRSCALGVADHVMFLGSCPAGRVRDVLGRADVFVLSSLSEGTANSVLEAMALEVPVVSSSAGGMSEVLTDGVDAMLVPPGDPDSLAAAVERIIEHPGMAAGMAAAGRRTVVEGYTVERQTAEWGSLYTTLLSPGSSERSVAT